ncbi:DUF4263 domain-containing protein [Acidobacteriia bacterium AH_259_A11_L15]|nr:DUF4263 domain-containing protein [Acidobacteriia bacterium AH_259_A11_L15]
MSDDSTLTPQVAFLGMCDRASDVTEGHPAFWHTNILGLSTSKVFHVFPFSLKGHRPFLAIYNPVIGETISLGFRGKRTKRFFDLKLTASEGETYAIDERGTVVSKKLSSGATFPGWRHFAAPIEVDIVVLDPDTYDVLHILPDDEAYLGSLELAHAPVQPYTAEDLTALRSDPLALKFVRASYSCNQCGAGLKTYAGIEKSERLESDGWVWNLDLHEDFRCACGKLEFSPKYLRTGLHGLLRCRLMPGGKDIFDSVRLYERSVLEQKCREFLKLLDSDPVEQECQDFLEKNPLFFSLFQAEKILVKKPVLSYYVVDFAILNQRRELLLVEIERPGLPLLRKDGGLRSEPQHALDQVRHWLQKFDDHRAAALGCFGLTLEEVAKVKGVVIAGRTPPDDIQNRYLRSLDFGDIDLYTFDDLDKATADIVRHIATV